MNVSTDLNTCTSNVTNLPLAQAADNCGVRDLWNGAVSQPFALGSTSVTSYAVDNNGMVASCTFSVVVSDTQIPTLGQFCVVCFSSLVAYVLELHVCHTFLHID